LAKKNCNQNVNMNGMNTNTIHLVSLSGDNA